MRRLVGYVEPETKGEGDEGSVGQADAFGFDSDEGSDGEAVVDRLYLKHRAHKLTAVRAKAAAATVGSVGGSSPSASSPGA